MLNIRQMQFLYYKEKTVFADGESETTILIPVAGDDAREANELMTLNIVSSSTGTTIVSNESSTDITIVNDDDLVTLDATAKIKCRRK